jgi:hypothetical protein
MQRWGGDAGQGHIAVSRYVGSSKPAQGAPGLGPPERRVHPVLEREHGLPRASPDHSSSPRLAHELIHWAS